MTATSLCMANRRTAALACALLLVALAGCSKPKPPEKERPPEPQAAHTQLRDAIRAPIEKARDVDAATNQAADAQRAAIEAAGG